MNNIGWTDAELRESAEKSNEVNNAYMYGYDQARREFERPEGGWKLIAKPGLTYIYQCSLCGRTISTTPMFLADYPFCHCGADMRGKEE